MTAEDDLADIRTRDAAWTANYAYMHRSDGYGQAAADRRILLKEIERLQRAWDTAYAQAMANGTRALQARHERDCAVEDVKRLDHRCTDLRVRLREAISLVKLRATTEHWTWIREVESELSDDVIQQRIIDRTADELTAASEVASAFRQPGLLVDAAASAGGTLSEGCTRSHPHEEMNAECERLTEIARSGVTRSGEST